MVEDVSDNYNYVILQEKVRFTSTRIWMQEKIFILHDGLNSVHSQLLRRMGFSVVLTEDSIRIDSSKTIIINILYLTELNNCSKLYMSCPLQKNNCTVRKYFILFGYN